MRIRAGLARSRRRVLVLLALALVLGAVAAHHGVPMDMHDMPAGAVCLAVLGAGLAVAVAIGALVIRRPAVVPRLWQPVWVWAPGPYLAPARAGPLFLILQVIRR